MTKSWKCATTFLRDPFLFQPSLFKPPLLHNPHQMINIHEGLFRGKKKKNPSSVSLSIWLSLLPWLWQTELPHNGNEFHASAFILRWLHALVRHYVLWWNYETELSSWSMVTALPYAAWRISNWEHMVQCSSLFCFCCLFYMCQLDLPTVTHSTFLLQGTHI